ncbi:DUF485 domain-containing protein [Streptomyces sp. NPDC005574]|uniref:DUF485 domain-containing protein n=1 Tax=Streptomyces sp. NPDC005574 TaxID=3156891 RepID=UPI0033A0C292
MSFDSSELYPARHRHGRHSSPDPALRTPSPAPRSAEPATGAPDPAAGRTWPGGRRPRSWTGHHRHLRLLRRACRWQRRVATLAALGYFAVFLTLTVRVPSVMTRPAPGGLPTGLVLALLQLPVTWLAVVLFECTARRYVDPLARRVSRHAYPADRDGEPQP